MSHLWLRDNCICDDCRIVQTDEKKFMVCSVPVDIEPQSVEIVDDCLHIVWPDGHISRYEGEYLRSLGQDVELTGARWPQNFVPHRYDYHSFLGDDNTAVAAIEEFITHGAIILSAAPTESGTLEQLAPRLGPMREVLFARIHDVAVDPSGYNVAHTPLPLPPHNDFASYTWPPSVQALHMLENETAGGESILVDGWEILTRLRDDYPDYFETLREMPVPFREFDDNTETYAVQPIIRCDTEGTITGLRFSNQLMQTIDPNDRRAASFYRAYHELCRRITDPAGQVSFRLHGGEILIVAAHRVLHGRQAFQPAGRRHLQDAYFEMDNVRNYLVVLRRKGGASNER
jgi:gamma-butyrobetaine dioxygenase